MSRLATVRSLLTTLVLLLAAAVLPPSTALAAPPDTPAPSDEAAVTALLDAYHDVRKEATAAVSIGYFDAREATTSHYGFMDIENEVPVDDDSVYEWGSVSKLLVWVSVMQLEEQGLLKRSDPASNHLDGTGLTFEQPFTIQDLMNHQAGFSEIPYAPETPEAAYLMDLDEALRHYQPPQIYEPGTVTSYSNYGTALAALIVEKAAGKPFQDYVRSEIFEPLGMDTTTIKPDWTDNPTVAERRAANKSYLLMEGYEEAYGAAISYIHLYPAGSAIGTLEDFMKFGRGLLPDTDESGALFDNPETLTEFFSGSTFYAGTEVIQNSNGLWFLPHGDGILGHGGNTQGYTSTLFIEPSSARGLVVMTNEVAETSYTYGLLQEFFGDYQTDPVVFGGEPSSDLGGIYTNARMNMPQDLAKFSRYMGGLLPLQADEETGGYRLMIGPGTVQHLGGDAYIMDSGNGLKTLLVLDGEPGAQTLQTYTGDNFKENTALFIARWVSVALFFVVTLISLVGFVVGLIRRGMRALARRRNPEAVAQKAPLHASTLVFHLVQVALGASVFLLLFMALGTDVDLSRLLAVIVGVLTLGLVGVWLIKPIKRMRPSILLTIIMIISVANVIYWRWFLA